MNRAWTRGESSELMESSYVYVNSNIFLAIRTSTRAREGRKGRISLDINYCILMMVSHGIVTLSLGYIVSAYIGASTVPAPCQGNVCMITLSRGELNPTDPPPTLLCQTPIEATSSWGPYVSLGIQHDD